MTNVGAPPAAGTSQRPVSPWKPAAPGALTKPPTTPPMTPGVHVAPVTAAEAEAVPTYLVKPPLMLVVSAVKYMTADDATTTWVPCAMLMPGNAYVNVSLPVGSGGAE